jgi:hypothetical protein
VAGDADGRLAITLIPEELERLPTWLIAGDACGMQGGAGQLCRRDTGEQQDCHSGPASGLRLDLGGARA